jgi:hypothetical protein
VADLAAHATDASASATQQSNGAKRRRDLQTFDLYSPGM